MQIADMEALRAYLAHVQERRDRSISCELTPALASRLTDAALGEALVTGLPMVQRLQRRIVRSRGRGAVLTAKLRYRDGVQLLACRDGDAADLLPAERDTLAAARTIAARALEFSDEEQRFRCLYDWLCRSVAYAHTAPGQPGYDRLVSATGALLDGRANCQGFADALCLLCGLCGIRAAYRCGRGVRQLHVWNEVCICGEWREVDASRGAREGVTRGRD